MSVAAANQVSDSQRAAALLVTARDVRVVYDTRARGKCIAVDRVSLRIARGETLGLVGESGCGKTSLARALLRLVPLTGGTVAFDGESIAGMRGPALRRFRRRAQMIFQDAGASLNPRMRVGAIIADPLRVHRDARGKGVRECVDAILAQVGLDRSLHDRFPHELSGGERQRVDLARALVLDPEFVVCDEPVSAVDAATRVVLLVLLRSQQRARRRSYLFITHDLAVAARMCDRIAVMYAGRIVEDGPVDAVMRRPRYPYTRLLQASVPRLDGAAPRDTHRQSHTFSDDGA